MGLARFKQNLWPLSCRWHGSRATKIVSYVRNTTEELTGQSDVAVAQAQVREKRNELKTWRQNVADATARYEEIQHKLRHLYAIKTQLYQAQRRDLAALQSINSEEEELLTSEQALSEQLDSVKQKERECFEALGDSILNSHERERAQSERMKYYSRLGSVLGAVLGFMGSNLFLRREVRKHQNLQELKMDNVEKALSGSVMFQASDSANIVQTLDNLGHGMKQVLQEENERQSQLEKVVHELASLSTHSTQRGSVALDQSTLIVTALGLSMLSYVACVVAYISMAVSR